MRRQEACGERVSQAETGGRVSRGRKKGPRILTVGSTRHVKRNRLQAWSAKVSEGIHQPSGQKRSEPCS